MKPKRRSSLVAATALLALLALPAMAAASRTGNSERAFMHLPGTNGYGVTIRTFSGRVVELEAAKGPGLASYTAHGKVANGRVEAKFGKLGHISLRFENPSGHSRLAEKPGGPCGKNKTTTELGVFRGTVVFNGEQGFTRVSAHRAKGKLERSTRPTCDASRVAVSPDGARLDRRPGSVTVLDLDPTTIHAISPFPGEGLSFAAYRLTDDAEWSFSADLGEHREGVEIERYVDEFAGPGSVQLSDQGHRPAAATVSPPAPFSGTATYARGASPATGTWDGSLSVFLPGAGQVPVAGSEFKAAACHFKDGDRSFNCLSAIEQSPDD